MQVELQQMEFITKYPVHMQRGLIQTGAYESYETGRVIIRYGRRPYAFYLVLAGSGITRKTGNVLQVFWPGHDRYSLRM